MPTILGIVVSLVFCGTIFGLMFYIARRRARRMAIAEGRDPDPPRTPKQLRDAAQFLAMVGLACFVGPTVAESVAQPKSPDQALVGEVLSWVAYLAGAVMLALSGAKFWQASRAARSGPTNEPPEDDQP